MTGGSCKQLNHISYPASLLVKLPFLSCCTTNDRRPHLKKTHAKRLTRVQRKKEMCTNTEFQMPSRICEAQTHTHTHTHTHTNSLETSPHSSLMEPVLFTETISSEPDMSCTSHANRTHKDNIKKYRQKQKGLTHIYTYTHTHPDCLYMFFRMQFEIRLRGGLQCCTKWDVLNGLLERKGLIKMTLTYENELRN